METFSQFQPTQFDAKGLGSESKPDWLIGPCAQTRDSKALDRSNFEILCCELKKIDPNENDHEIHRFGHWGPGWFEIVIIRPDSACAQIAQKYEDSLAEYPVLNEEHFSECECNEACDAWEQMPITDRISIIQQVQEHGNDCSIFAARRDEIPREIPIEMLLTH